MALAARMGSSIVYSVATTPLMMYLGTWQLIGTSKLIGLVSLHVNHQSRFVRHHFVVRHLSRLPFHDIQASSC